MKFLTNNPSNLFKIEFWAATTIYVFLIFFHLSDAVGINWATHRVSSGNSTIPFNFFFVSRIITYTILYLAFLFLNFRVVPELVQRKNMVLNVLLVILVFTIIGLAYGVRDTYLRELFVSPAGRGTRPFDVIFQNQMLYALWLLLLFGFYTAVKYFGMYLLGRTDKIQAKYKFATPEGIVILVLWMISIFILLLASAEREVYSVWGVVVPFSVIFYWYSFQYSIPRSLGKKRPILSYALNSLLVLTLAFPVVLVIGIPISAEEDLAAATSLFNSLFQLMVMAPILWLLFKRQMKGNEEIYKLKRELGQSHASFDFLRSQINPHFLFNALNTIYGTALSEKAERTSEGIEKLGDMMRFMLQENMQDKISLSREIDYLNNYISLQKLRTDPNPNIRIVAQIQDDVLPVQIAPMLLIPFVENAFKHGISFREPSHINISLEVKDKTVYFDVHNSKHAKQDNDPEKDYTGIGLTNVRQRLQLMYPGRHELIIRETAKDFFIHLTVKLS